LFNYSIFEYIPFFYPDRQFSRDFWDFIYSTDDIFINHFIKQNYVKIEV